MADTRVPHPPLLPLATYDHLTLRRPPISSPNSHDLFQISKVGHGGGTIPLIKRAGSLDSRN